MGADILNYIPIHKIIFSFFLSAAKEIGFYLLDWKYIIKADFIIDLESIEFD